MRVRKLVANEMELILDSLEVYNMLTLIAILVDVSAVFTRQLAGGRNE